MSLLDSIPGYRQAVERENDVRNAAFLSINETLCGIEVRPLTLRMFLMLDGLGSPFVTGRGSPSMRDCVQFVWCISPQFNPARRGWRRVLRRCKRAGHLSLLVGIGGYLKYAMMDAPAGRRGSGESPSYYSWATSYVDALASEYRWSERDILDMPMKRLFQYVKLLQRKHNATAPMFNPSDKVRSDWLAEVNKRRAATCTQN